MSEGDETKAPEIVITRTNGTVERIRVSSFMPIRIAASGEANRQFVLTLAKEESDALCEILGREKI